MSAVSSPVHDEDEVRIKEETRFSFVQDIQRQADRVAKGLILKEQDYNSPKVSRKPSSKARTPISHRNGPAGARLSPRQFAAQRRKEIRARKAVPKVAPGRKKAAASATSKTPVNRRSTRRAPGSANPVNRVKAEAGVRITQPTLSSAAKTRKAPTSASRKRSHAATTNSTDFAATANATPADETASPKKAVKIFEKTTVAYETRLQLNSEAREKKMMTPGGGKKSRFSDLGSLYWSSNGLDSPHRTEFMDPPSSLNTTGGYISTTERPKPKVATEIGPLELIGMGHTGVSKKPLTFTKAPKTPSSATKKAPGIAEKVKAEAIANRRRTVSSQLADGISSRLSSSNARIVNDSKVITTSQQLIDYQMNRALQYLAYHLATEAGQQVLRNIARDATGKQDNGVSAEDIETAREDLKHQLATAVKDHCSKWWGDNMKGAPEGRAEIKVKPIAPKLPAP
eukprot:INCI13675.1.p1 GENE.INCI13675.1~~INCI13675.1.p1  ORF type:complete len:456 (+),score=90.21 INCI13675.1:186-1553(+)